MYNFCISLDVELLVFAADGDGCYANGGSKVWLKYDALDRYLATMAFIPCILGGPSRYIAK